MIRESGLPPVILHATRYSSALRPGDFGGIGCVNQPSIIRCKFPCGGTTPNSDAFAARVGPIFLIGAYESSSANTFRYSNNSFAVGGSCVKSTMRRRKRGTLESGSPYIVMEYLEGRPLSGLIAMAQANEQFQVVAALESEHPTFFEVVTVLALRYFAEQKCDLVIWETGMGGYWGTTASRSRKANT